MAPGCEDRASERQPDGGHTDDVDRGTPLCPNRGRGAGRSGLGCGDRPDRGRGRRAGWRATAATRSRPRSRRRSWAVALQQLRDPMNLMLVAVTVVSLLIGEISTGVIVGAADPAQRGARHPPGAQGAGERRRAVEAAGARRRRWSATAPLRAASRPPTSCPATSCRSRPVTSCRPTAASCASATLETQEAALTGESAPVAKDAGRAGRRRGRARRPDEHALPEHLGDPGHRDDGRHGHRHGDPDGSDRDDADLGDAHPLAAAARARLPDQGARHHRLGGGRVHRGGRAGRAAMPFSELLLLGTAMAISAIPTGMPAFVSGPAVPWAPSSWPTPRPWSRT